MNQQHLKTLPTSTFFPLLGGSFKTGDLRSLALPFLRHHMISIADFAAIQ